LVAFVAVGMSAAVATAQNPHFSQPNPPTCEVISRPGARTCTVCCAGTIVGVGSEPTSVVLDVANSGCLTRGNETAPPGHLQATSAPINPESGNITFACEQVRVSLTCPGGLNTVLGPEATISIQQDGEVTPVGTVDIEGECS
jgi:hypothetical protein